MAITQEYRDFILEKLDVIGDITCKPMMGEYLLYYRTVLFGRSYDNRLLIKKAESNETCGLPEQLPYTGAKPMLAVEELDDEDMLKSLVIDTYTVLAGKKQRRAWKRDRFKRCPRK